MREPYWWYVLYVRSNTEKRVIDSVQKAFSGMGLPYELEAFCPESEQYYRGKAARESGKQYRKRPLFPGYVFLETTVPSAEFRKAFYDVINNSADIIRLLRNAGSGDIAIAREERVRLEYLLCGKRCLDRSEGYIEGDRIFVTGGPLLGREGSIKKINRHNRSALIEIEMFGQTVSAEVALEVVSKQ